MLMHVFSCLIEKKISSNRLLSRMEMYTFPSVDQSHQAVAVAFRPSRSSAKNDSQDWINQDKMLAQAKVSLPEDSNWTK